MQKKQAIIIMTDTQRRDMLGCYSRENVRTPNLDRLAADGVVFERAYCCDPVCTPARSAIFTGTYPHTNGAWTNCLAMGTDMVTLGQRLSAKGIHCGYVGKWHLDGNDYAGNGIAPPGWDPEYWYDLRCYLEALTPEERRLSRQEASIGQVGEEFCFANHCSKRAIDFIEQSADQDFLLVASYEEPHHPSLAPEPFASLFDDDDLVLDANTREADMTGKPELHRVWAEAHAKNIPDRFLHLKRRFLACNAYVDYEIGKVLDAIDRCCPDALIIYTADHGFSLGNRGGLFDKGPAAYEEITGVPLIVRKEGLVPSGTRHAGPTSHIDITPTVMDFMGLPPAPIIEGRSMMPVLKTPDAPFRTGVFIEFGRYTLPHDSCGGFQPYRACVTDRYKLCINLLDKDELYDLANDADELVNLIDSPEHAEVRDRMHDRILEWMGETRDPFRGYHWERRPWRTDARPAAYYRPSRIKRVKPGDEGFNPQPLNYNTGMPAENGPIVL